MDPLLLKPLVLPIFTPAVHPFTLLFVPLTLVPIPVLDPLGISEDLPLCHRFGFWEWFGSRKVGGGFR